MTNKIQIPLLKGGKYQIVVDVYPFEQGKTETRQGIFLNSFPCYDARQHGAGDPSDYFCYEFAYVDAPQMGVFRHYAKQLHSVIAVGELQ